MERKSEYFSALSVTSRARYEKKVVAAGLTIDPYCIERWNECLGSLPDVNWSNMIIYLTATPSENTLEAMKAWKGMLDGGCFMRAGWVHQFKLYAYSIPEGERFVAMGKVKHSQRISSGFLLPWVIVKKSGEVLAAHCTCMAGLGEACSHVAAILSCMINATESRKEKGLDSCTSNLCGWNHSAKEVKPAFFSDIQFYGQSSRKRCLENASNSVSKRATDSSLGSSSSSPNNDNKDSSSNSRDGNSHGESSGSKDSGGNSKDGSSHGESSSSKDSGDHSRDGSSHGESSGSKDSSDNSKDGSSHGESSSSKDSGDHSRDGSSHGESSNSNSSSTDSSSNQDGNDHGEGSSSKDSGGNSKGTGKKLETSNEEQQKFLSTLNLASIKPAILRIVLPYAESLAPKVTLPDYPKLITELYNPSTLCLTYPELLTECERIYGLYKVTKEQSASLEANTRDQSTSKLWSLHRTGRITASNFKAAAVTNRCMPSQSLIKRLCYPAAYKFSTAATRWGCTHEKVARDAYHAMMIKKHDNFKCSDAGLFIDHVDPFLGASPDCMVQCSCCGKGVVEIKCPYCHKDLPEHDDSTFCMVNQRGAWSLKRDHMYYYQVQLQLHICDVTYADFVLWTENDMAIERIHEDQEFFGSKIENVRHFFMYGILPEIIGKWYTRGPVADPSGVVTLPTTSASTAKDPLENQDEKGKLWCFCNQPSYGEMIMCDHKKCTIQWFHFDCLRIRVPPKGKWYCPSCSKLPQYNKKK